MVPDVPFPHFQRKARLKQMNSTKRMIRSIRQRWLSFFARFRSPIRSFVCNVADSQKWALLSYLPDAINLTDNDKRLKGHSNWWECRELARILFSFGFNIESISHGDHRTKPKRHYDLILDIATNLQRLAPEQKRATFILLLTGSHYDWTKRAEAKRVEDFTRRHGVAYRPRYATVSPEELNRSLEIADCCLLIGNEITLKTYPERFQRKIRLVPVSGSKTSFLKNFDQPRTGSFLYFSTPRNVLKGLDLVLDVFLRHSEWRLHIVGNVDSENDFMAAYPDVGKCRNIRFHGFLLPSSKRFEGIVEMCDAVILPSCSEGTSTSVLTCTQMGLYPIISKHTGVSLPEGCGVWIENLSPDGVESAVSAFCAKPMEEIRREAKEIQRNHLHHHSREAFSNSIRTYLEQALHQ